MGLITKEVEITLNPNNINYYKNLKYEIPKHKDSNYKLRIKQGTKILVKIEDLPENSNAKVNVKCDGCGKQLKNKRWVDYKKCAHENGEYYCLKCAINLYGKEKTNNTKLKKDKSFEQWCIENDKQNILNRWDYELNNCKPSEIIYRSTKKYYFKCPRGLHKSELKDICIITRNETKAKCNACNSFAQCGIDNLGEDFLEKYWDYDKNNELRIDPWKISKCTNKPKFYIKCQKNILHGSYDTNSNNFTQIHRCPECTREKTESILQEKVRLYLESLNKYTILHENNCTIIPKNPKTKYQLPFDNEVKELRLIIETHGIQHYKLSNWHKRQAKHNNTTPEYEFYMQKVRDRYKRIFAQSKINNYFYLEIPYWSDDKDETWKQLINDKINEINNIKYIEQQNKSS